jgi:hypothetical protein
MSVMKKIVVVAGGLVVLLVVVGVGIYKFDFTNDDIHLIAVNKLDPENGTYRIEGESVTLKDGYQEKTSVSGAVSRDVIRYFGNEVLADLNNDGIGDAAFLLVRESGGSGTFYYVAAQISQAERFVGTSALFIGDRIAPQTTEFRDGMVIVNYADRKPGDPYTTLPSVGVSRYYKLVDGEFKEVTPQMGEAAARAIAEKSCIKGGEALGTGSYNENTKTWWFDANLNAVQAGCSPACVVNELTGAAEVNWRCTGLVVPE